MKMKKGDNVKIISGKDRGKTGKITHVFPDEEKIVVEGVNVHKKHTRPKKQGQKGQIIQMPMPIHMSNAMIVCRACGKATRVGVKTTEKAAKGEPSPRGEAGRQGREKIRICKKCGGEL